MIHSFKISLLNNIDIINTSIIFKNIKQSIKEYDIIFSSSSYDRCIKNSILACKIFSDKRLLQYNKIIIGENFPDTIKLIPNLIYINKNIKHSNFQELLCKTKILFLPSFYDSMPNILYEALSYNVKPLVSNRIECELLDSDNIFNLLDNNDIIINKIELLLNKHSSINIDKFDSIKQSELLKFNKLLNLNV